VAQIYKFNLKFECKFSAPLYCIFNILIFLLRGRGLELRSALQLSKRVEAQGEHSEAKELPFSFLWERRFYLRSVCSYERSEVERRPFLSQALSNPTARYKLLRYAQV